jgi:hypothetical protein
LSATNLWFCFMAHRKQDILKSGGSFATVAESQIG